MRQTRSVCPLCLKNLPTRLVRQPDGSVTLEKECPDHGFFSQIIWRGLVDFDTWTRNAPPLGPEAGLSCPENCGICTEHEADSCCVLLEVTPRCNLRCRFCFADGGASLPDPSLESMKAAIRDIVAQRGQPLLQLSGGEPTLRDDLPLLVAYAKEAGCSYVQLNTNGLRLAHEPEYARALWDAGLDIVFLQFDGTEDRIYELLRGKPLLEAKKQAISVCGGLGLGVTLVPTLVPGVNTENLGGLIAFAASQVPVVRGIHFQPVSYFGRIPELPREDLRYTLDQLMADISRQAGIALDSFLPSRCDHPLCGFHGNFLLRPDGSLRLLSSLSHSSPSRGCARDNREYVARNWIRPPAEAPVGDFSEEMDFDTFLYHLRQRKLTLSAMAFQDAGNLNIERLHRCSLHVYSGGTVKPFCAHYLTKQEKL